MQDHLLSILCQKFPPTSPGQTAQFHLQRAIPKRQLQSVLHRLPMPCRTKGATAEQPLQPPASWVVHVFRFRVPVPVPVPVGSPHISPLALPCHEFAALLSPSPPPSPLACAHVASMIFGPGSIGRVFELWTILFCLWTLFSYAILKFQNRLLMSKEFANTPGPGLPKQLVQLFPRCCFLSL
jgi:hypothetical protein